MFERFLLFREVRMGLKGFLIGFARIFFEAL